MKELVKRVVNKLNTNIQELEIIYNENKKFITDAANNKIVAQSEVDIRMQFAKEQLNSLKEMKAWKEYYKTTYLN